jgi:NADH dehydrogenase FAD-containing subunit
VDVFVIGGAASLADTHRRGVPEVSHRALQMGPCVACLINLEMRARAGARARSLRAPR